MILKHEMTWAKRRRGRQVRESHEGDGFGSVEMRGRYMRGCGTWWFEVVVSNGFW